MKHLFRLISIISITAIALSAAWLSPPAMSCELSQAVIRAVWNEETTQPVAKSVGRLEVIGAGDRFAVVQYVNGAWALVLVPHGVPAQPRDVVQLTPDVTSQSSSEGKITVVKMLTSASGPSRFVSCIAVAGSGSELN
jgi:hypothetical protein